MNEQIENLEKSRELAIAVGEIYRHRAQRAQQQFSDRMQAALKAHSTEIASTTPWGIWQDWYQYANDAVQRSILFWDIMRERGNVFVEHKKAGKPPVLNFDYEIIVDGRNLSRPVNYALTRIIPPEGVNVDPKRRPYVIIDPRAGHGPGIGGFKDDSQVGVALEDGHPVYFVIFFPDPEPDQTLIDICDAERQFIHHVRDLHPDSAAPVVIGNCQGGWAAMMVASSAPEDTGPIVLNGAPLSYWGGAWSEDAGDNPMRYAGGLLGGSWPASFSSDIGAGKFDGAHLVQNFENLNPANTFWDKYYNLYSKVDTERKRFLEFERWWGGFYLLNESEINWIVQDLFVGNKLASGETPKAKGQYFDLRSIQSPIIVFASMGDNITPPQQAFNWIADLYGSTEEIKARGQIIVGLLHQDVGHLGIFVSGRVAKKEHRQIVSVLKSVEALPPGLWGMEIHESTDADGNPTYDVSFVEHRLEEVVQRLNRFQREDEKAFEAVADISEFNQRVYELFAQPLVRAFSNETSAEIARDFHPLRFQRWAFSDLNPFMWWLKPAAAVVQSNRETPPLKTNALAKTEKLVSEGISASLDLYRGMRDAASEAMFLSIYGNLFAFEIAGKPGAWRPPEADSKSGASPWMKDALSNIENGGYAEAVARAAFLLRHKGVPMPLSRIELTRAFVDRNADLLPDLPLNEIQKIRGQQELVVNADPERALQTLPILLTDDQDRSRFVMLLERVVNDPDRPEAVPEQVIMFDRICTVLNVATEAVEPAPEQAQKVRAATGT